MLLSDESLHALYRINKEAKRHASLASTAYKNGRKRDAKRHSHKKEALYELKARVLQQSDESADKIEQHKIDGSEYYCLYFSDWSFHVPAEEVSIPKRNVDSRKVLHEFNPTHLPERTSMSIRSALEHFRDVWGLNANRFADPIPPESEFGHSEPIDWSYLCNSPSATPLAAAGD